MKTLLKSLTVFLLMSSFAFLVISPTTALSGKERVVAVGAQNKTATIVFVVYGRPDDTLMDAVVAVDGKKLGNPMQKNKRMNLARNISQAEKFIE